MLKAPWVHQAVSSFVSNIVCYTHHWINEEEDEFVVRPGYRIPEEKAKFRQAPEPLLANYGEARIRQYTMDINMMTLLNSKERTLEDFIGLGESAGLQFVKLWETGEMGLVEFVQQPRQGGGRIETYAKF